MHHIQFILKFGSIESKRTFYKKNIKIISAVRRATNSYLIRFGKRLNFDSFTVFDLYLNQMKLIRVMKHKVLNIEILFL
jgi:hypothetical protein